MATVYKVLGQTHPTANTNTSLYTVPASTQAICSTLSICNMGATAIYNIAIRPNGSTLADQHYLVFNATINQFDTVMLTIGIALGAGDVITVWANSSDITFQVFGSEITP